METAIRKLRRKVRVTRFKMQNRGKTPFTCPVCAYCGPFRDMSPDTGERMHAQCPNCTALERHRLQMLALKDLVKKYPVENLKMLHFAPEPFLTSYFSEIFGSYETADLMRDDVDHKVDIQTLPFDDNYCDFIFASHVLEHIPDDLKALREIQRVLRPDGVAVLPVPVLGDKTVEYPEPNPHETDHVRAPGMDYFDRYREVFSRVELHNSESLPDKYQLFVYEDRSNFPSEKFPLRLAVPGLRHSDVVPICYK